MVAHEVVHSIRASKSQSMMVKLDIKKAYDEVDRGFMLNVLRRFGFGQDGFNGWKVVFQPQDSLY